MREGAISFEKMNARVENTASADATGNRLKALEIWLVSSLNSSVRINYRYVDMDPIAFGSRVTGGLIP